MYHRTKHSESSKGKVGERRISTIRDSRNGRRTFEIRLIDDYPLRRVFGRRHKVLTARMVGISVRLKSHRMSAAAVTIQDSSSFLLVDKFNVSSKTPSGKKEWTCKRDPK